jgi:hypothetical protein
MGNDQHISQVEIAVPIWVHLQLLIEDKNPKTKHGDPKVWYIKGLMKSLSPPKKVTSQLQPSDQSESRLSRYAASLRVNGHNMVVA